MMQVKKKLYGAGSNWPEHASHKEPTRWAFI